MFKNKKVILSSIAIVFTLVVCSIFVNFTLANSGSPTANGDAGSGTNSSLTGYSNIDLAVINSNDAGLKATGDDKFRVVQILPDGLKTVADIEAALTTKVTAANYSGKVTSESDWGNTSYLWRYIYGDEYFRLAVFNGYKTITTAEMAEGAVQLTSVTVSELNSMNTSAQEILSRADMIYIYSSNSSDYGAAGADLSEELYSWLDVYATTDRHPIAICRKALCTDDPTTISGNNDTYRMGALAYKLITKNLMARYDNVLVTEEDFFKTLYEEAEDGKEIPDMPDTTKTISDFILTAERGANEGGNGYLNFNTYYKWYDGTSIQDFLDPNVYSGDDSAYVFAGDKAGITGDRKEWDFDNANILVISEGTSSSMFNTMSGMNSNSAFAASDYKYNIDTKKWEAVELAPNSELTNRMYDTGITGDSKHIPSGANLYLLDSSKFMDAITSGSSFDDMKLSSSYYKDVETKSISGSIKVVPELGGDNAIDLEGWSVCLVAKDENGVYHYVSKDAATGYEFTLSSSDAKYYEYDDETDTCVYKYEFVSLNANYEYSAVLVSPEGVGYADYRIGRMDNDFVVDNASVDDTDTPEQQGYDYTSVNTADDFDNKIVSEPGAYSDVYLSEYMIFSVDDPSEVYNYVTSLHDVYANEQLAYSQGFGPLDLTQYDFIFIDKGKYSTEIGQTAYDALCSAVEKGVYVIASSAAGDGKGSGNGSGGSGSTTIIVNSPSAKAVADIINAGVYRDGSDNKFKVLEIQPDYPIDEEVAKSLPNVSTAWKTKSDGKTPITGDYYTVPSDVESGKAKEELPSAATEYYAFDLTKAKIAYAIDGLNYGDIELTQVSTEALIGMKEDIAATYDLVYIGGDISALDRNPVDMYKGQHNLGNATAGYSYRAIPTFIMYYHTGNLSQLMNAGTYKMDRSATGNRMMATPYAGGTYYTDTYIAENGNDLTSPKYDELMNYINAGRPVIVSSELTSMYENMQGTNAAGKKLSDVELRQGFWYNNGTLERGNVYLDPSSRMYQLVGNIYTRYTGANGSNIWWGFNPDKAASTKMIANTDEKYGKTNYTYYRVENKSYLDDDAQGYEWYNKGSEIDVIKKYAVVLNDDYNDMLNKLIHNSKTRTRLTITSKPTKYVQGITSTYIKTNNLAFTFTVTGSDSTYKYELYVDKDKNTAFNEDDYNVSGTVSSGVEKSISLAVEQDFFGAASWYLVIKDASGKTVVAEQTGLSKIINNNVSKSEINVLQVQTMAEGQGATSWTATDTLYFDITSQTSHKIAKYNTYANQTELDNVSAAQYATLGLHENRFGIVEYDIGRSNDDYLSNLADEIADDYDINLDMVVASANQAKFTTADGVNAVYDCLDTWVAEAETLKAGGTVDGMTQAEYAAQVSVKLTAYSAAAAQVDPARTAIQKYVQGALDSLNGTYSGTTNYSGFFSGFKSGVSDATKKEILQFVIDTNEYYLLFWPVYSNNSGFDWDNKKVPTMYGQKFADLYADYVKVKDKEILARDEYNKYLRRSYGKDFMKRMYSILLLGPSDSFGGFRVDFNAKTCEYILDYVSAGGDLFFFHDAMTPFADQGGVNLTKSLLEVVGMNRFHVDLTDQTNSYEIKDTVFDAKNSSVTWHNGQTFKDVKFKSSDSDLYYMTPYDATGKGLLNSMNEGIYIEKYKDNAYWQPGLDKNTKAYISALAMTALYYNGNMAGATTTLPYVYAQESFTQATAWSAASNADQSACSETVKASRLNEGLITLYPYSIGESLNIAGTHQQTYALDLETDKITVWYTLAGSNNSSGAKTRSSKYAADPYDAMEAYFIYTTSYGQGAVTYCGAGHSSVTGKTTRNNDERKLFINVIVNSALAVPPTPSIKVYEPTGEFKADDELEKDEEAMAEGQTVYKKTVDNKTDIPEFDMKVSIPEGTKLSKVNIYFDLDYDDSSYKNRPSYIDNDEHVLIKSYSKKDGKDISEIEKELRDMLRGGTDPKLKLQDSYFQPYGGNYTYIVIEVYYEGKTTPAYAMIKIKASDPLFDLTQNDEAAPAMDALAEKKLNLA